MVTITIKLEDGNMAANVCREVAIMIEDGFKGGMCSSSSYSFNIEGDIFSDKKEDDDVKQTESGKTEVRITSVENHTYPSSYHGDMVNTSRLRLTELFGEDIGAGDKTNHEWVLLFDVKYNSGVSEQFGVDLYDWKYDTMQEDAIIYWNIGSNNIFNSSTAREVIDMLISGQFENDEYKIIEVKKK